MTVTPGHRWSLSEFKLDNVAPEAASITMETLEKDYRLGRTNGKGK